MTTSLFCFQAYAERVVLCDCTPPPQKADSKKADSKKVDSKKVDSRKPDSKKVDSKKPDSKKPDSKKADSMKAGSKEADEKPVWAPKWADVCVRNINNNKQYIARQCTHADKPWYVCDKGRRTHSTLWRKHVVRKS